MFFSFVIKRTLGHVNRALLSTTVGKPHSHLRALNGDVVPYPVGIEKPINHPILYVGSDALKGFLPDDAPRAALINQAQEIYAHVFRPHLMLLTRGAWVVCSSKKDLFIVPTQKEAVELAHRLFQPADGSVDCYVGCVGSEYAVGIAMDDVMSGEAKEGNPQADETGLYLPVEFSADLGKTFTTFTMKHVSGADIVGAPRAVLSNYTLRRDIAETVYISGAQGDYKRCNVYKDLLFRLNGLVTKTSVVELTGSRWLLGQPIYLRYRNVIDKTAPTILTMEPLPNEKDHA